MSRKKTFILKQYPEMQVSGGTVDISSYKSIYLQIRGHLFADNDNGVEELKHFYWGIKQTINEALNYSICKKDFISELEFSDTFKKKTYSYFIMDFTFYPNDLYHKNTYTNFLDEIVKKIHRDNFIPSPFEFYAYKKDYQLEDKDINSIRTPH